MVGFLPSLAGIGLVLAFSFAMSGRVNDAVLGRNSVDLAG
jgi:hypothetical protein